MTIEDTVESPGRNDESGADGYGDSVDASVVQATELPDETSTERYGKLPGG